MQFSSFPWDLLPWIQWDSSSEHVALNVCSAAAWRVLFHGQLLMGEQHCSDSPFMSPFCTNLLFAAEQKQHWKVLPDLSALPIFSRTEGTCLGTENHAGCQRGVRWEGDKWLQKPDHQLSLLGQERQTTVHVRTCVTATTGAKLL